MTLHQGTIRELADLPNIIPKETNEERVARLALQKIGSTEGIHSRVLAAQKAHSKIQRRIANKRNKS